MSKRENAFILDVLLFRIYTLNTILFITSGMSTLFLEKVPTIHGVILDAVSGLVFLEDETAFRSHEYKASSLNIFLDIYG